MYFYTHVLDIADLLDTIPAIDRKDSENRKSLSQQANFNVKLAKLNSKANIIFSKNGKTPPKQAKPVVKLTKFNKPVVELLEASAVEKGSIFMSENKKPWSQQTKSDVKSILLDKITRVEYDGVASKFICEYKAMAQHKTALTPLLTQWSYCSLVLSNRYHATCVMPAKSLCLSDAVWRLFGAKPLPKPIRIHHQ